MDRKQNQTVIDIRDLQIEFKTYAGALKVLNGVNLKVDRREKIAIVGETGCGKTTTIKAILKIFANNARITGGAVLFNGKDVLKMNSNEVKVLRGGWASMIFQDPTMSLNPVFTIGQQMKEVVRYSEHPNAQDEKVQEELAIKALEETSMPDAKRIMDSYPFQLSGGMRQRVCIAMSLATPRDIVLADEPTTNLDVTIQEQVLKILKERVERKGSSLILITHSLGVARETCTRINVMYAGNIVESAPSAELFKKQYHPYTHALLECIPKLTGGGVAAGISGQIPNYLKPPEGCRFCPRCPNAMPICKESKPETVLIEEEHYVACHLYGGGAHE